MSESYKTPDPHEQEKNEIKDRLVSEIFPLIKKGENEVLRAFLRRHPDVATIYSNSRRTALHMAVLHKNYPMMDFLLNFVPRTAKVSNGDLFIDCRDENGASALMEAIKENDLKAVQILLKHHPSFDVVEYETKEKAIHLAAENGNVAILAEIFRAKHRLKKPLGINEAGGKAGLYLLHFAAKEGRLNMVKYLIRLGADVNKKSVQAGRTPIMFAAGNEHQEVYNYLASLPQIDLTLCDKYGKNIAYFLDPKNLLEENKDNFDKVMDIISRNFNEEEADKSINEFFGTPDECPVVVAAHQLSVQKENQKINA
ncbi:MAG: ankyrin repeat domain-containing protein [Alphaproteobacteria bacterium]|nr:ankyrin repeat domain-containing protein [Alphaproteobacteria bacterium]